MKKLFGLLSTSILLSCCSVDEGTEVANSIGRDIGWYRSSEDQFKTDPVFYKYINLFESIFGKKVDVPIVFNHSLGPSVGAACSLYSSGLRIIEVNYDIWFAPPPLYNDDKEVYHEITLFHELAHCILNKSKHKNFLKTFIVGDKEITCPGSILNSSPMIPPLVYRTYRQYFLQEL